MARLPQVNGERLIRALAKAGWRLKRARGSHHILVHPERPTKYLIVPVHRHPLKPGTLVDILHEAELSVEQLKELL